MMMVHAPVFVIHKHQATHLHYDVRLEVNGKLASWAVPKGPSTDPRIKRLATHVPDHPRSYKDFEGVLPPNTYGAGPVMIWDYGTYENMSTDDDDKPISAEDAIKKGKFVFVLHGTKLNGAWALVQMRGGKNWLLIKKKDAYANKPRRPLNLNRSAVSNRTMQEIKDEETYKK